MANDPAATPNRQGIGDRIVSYSKDVPLAGFVVNLAIALFGGVDDWRVTTLEIGLT